MAKKPKLINAYKNLQRKQIKDVLNSATRRINLALHVLQLPDALVPAEQKVKDAIKILGNTVKK